MMSVMNSGKAWHLDHKCKSFYQSELAKERCEEHLCENILNLDQWFRIFFQFLALVAILFSRAEPF